MSSPLTNQPQPSLPEQPQPSLPEQPPFIPLQQDSSLLSSQHEPQILLSSKRERDKDEPPLTTCPKCGNVSEKELLSFTSCAEIINFIQSNLVLNNNEIDIRSDLFENVNQHDKIDIKLCYKCFYSNLFTNGLNWFMSSHEIQNKVNNVQEDKMIYKTYLENIIQCIDNVKSALINNITEHEHLITKLQMEFFFEKNKQVVSNFNKEIEKCKQQRIQTMETVKTLIDKTNEYSGINQILKTLPEDKLQQISEFIKNINNTSIHNIIPITEDNTAKQNHLTQLQTQNTKDKNKEDIKESNDNNNNNVHTNTNNNNVNINSNTKPNAQGGYEDINHNIIPPISSSNEPVSPFNHGELKISSESSSIETNSKTTKKKNYVIRSLKPIHESNYKASSTTPISPLSGTSNQEVLTNQISKQQQQQHQQQSQTDIINSTQNTQEQHHQQQNQSQLNTNKNSTLVQNNIPLKVTPSPNMQFMQMQLQNQMNPSLPLNPFNLGPPQLQQNFPPSSIYDQGPMNSNFDLYNLFLKHNLLSNDKLNPPPPGLYNTNNNNNQLFPMPSNPPFQPPPSFYGLDPMLIASQQQYQKLAQKVPMNPPNVPNLPNTSQFDPGLIYGTLFPRQQDDGDINAGNLNSNLYMKNTYGDLTKKNETKNQRNQMIVSNQQNSNNNNNNSGGVSNMNDSAKK